MKYFLVLYIICTFFLGLWQTFRFNYKSKLSEQLLLPLQNLDKFQNSEFSKIFLKDLKIKNIFRFYVNNKDYKLITITSLHDQNVLLDLGLCRNCNFENIKKKFSEIKSINAKVLIMPINRFNNVKKILFTNDYTNNLLFYYDIKEIAKFSEIQTNNSETFIDKYILFNIDFIHDSIEENNIKIFNPHLYYLIFWYCLSIFGIISFYIKYKKTILIKNQQ